MMLPRVPSPGPVGLPGIGGGCCAAVRETTPPTTRALRPKARNAIQARQRPGAAYGELEAGSTRFDEFDARVQSWLAHAAFADPQGGLRERGMDQYLWPAGTRRQPGEKFVAPLRGGDSEQQANDSAIRGASGRQFGGGRTTHTKTNVAVAVFGGAVEAS